VGDSFILFKINSFLSNQNKSKMEYRQNFIGLIALFIVVTAFFSGCSKETTQDKSAIGYKVVLSELDLSFVPEGDLAEHMQGFFDAVNDYMEDPDAINTEYSISEGIWYLLTGINYTSANLLAQISEMEEYSFTHEIELAEDIPAGLTARGVISAFLGFYDDLQSLEESGYDVGLIRFDTITSGESGILLTLSALRGRVVEYADVESYSCPVGIPDHVWIKMGAPHNGYKSAADETADRYNPYLHQFKINQLALQDGYFLVSGAGPMHFHGFTNGDNCFDPWPDGDYILYVGCNPGQDPWDQQVNGSRFNLYLERYCIKKLHDMIDHNNDPNNTFKWLYTWIWVGYLPGVHHHICGGLNKSAFRHNLYGGHVEVIFSPLNTYTL